MFCWVCIDSSETRKAVISGKEEHVRKILVSMPDDIVARMQVVIPNRQRSKVITKLVVKEIRSREKKLYKCAMEVERDTALKAEMADWDVTLGDGIDI